MKNAKSCRWIKRIFPVFVISLTILVIGVAVSVSHLVKSMLCRYAKEVPSALGLNYKGFSLESLDGNRISLWVIAPIGKKRASKPILFLGNHDIVSNRIDFFVNSILKGLKLSPVITGVIASFPRSS